MKELERIKVLENELALLKADLMKAEKEPVVLEAASKCETAKQTLKTLFPDVFEEEFWELKTNENKEIYFVNTLTKQSFNVGDEITIKDSSFRFGDDVRNHTISGFHYQFGEVIKNTLCKKVYASFKGYSFERALLLDQIIKL